MQEAIEGRGGTVRGITTEASPLYPQPLAEVFPAVPHQICEFHILKELTKAGLRLVARLGQQLAVHKLPRWGEDAHAPPRRNALGSGAR